MPKINITEQDMTSPGSLNVTTNTVYVPGFATVVPQDFNFKPRLYNSLSAFQADFGNKVPELQGEEIQDSFQFGAQTINVYPKDTGYIYAVELLRLGTPVLYDVMFTEDDLSYFIKKLSDGTLVAYGGTPSINIANGITEGDDKTFETEKIYVDGESKVIYKLYKSPKLTDGTNTLSKAKAQTFLFGKGGRLVTEELNLKGTYNIKFLTTGGYMPSSSDFNNQLCSISAAREDCVALIDHVDTIQPNELLGKVKGTSFTKPQYAAMFTPYAFYTPPCLADDIRSGDINESLIKLPASFGYLMAMAQATKSAPNWMAMAGATRGTIPHIVSLAVDLSEAVAETYSSRDSVSINPIVNVNPFGLIIWGNRTLFNNAAKGNLTASSFLNIRNLISDVKKTVWTAARQMTFEQNSDILWINFKSLITPTLDQMVSGNGLSAYELKKRTAKQKATLSAVIRLFAIEAVEDFEIEIQLADSSTAILE